MKDYLAGNAEILPIFCEDKEFFAINVTTVLDCIDYESSEYETFKSSGRIMCFIKYSFIEDEIKNVHIFKTKDETLGYPFVSEAFRQRVLESDLTGFKFELVWDSEEEKRAVIENEEQSNTSKERKNYFAYVGELDFEVKQEIERTSRTAMEIFRISNPKNGQTIAKEVYDIVENILSTDTFPSIYESLDDVAVALGVLFGQALCIGYGWSWQEFGNSKEDAVYGVVSPQKNFCIAPMNFLFKILSRNNIGLDGKNDNTVLLLYNMLADIDKKPESTKYFPLL